MYLVYALSSIKRNYIYVGLTNSVERRFVEHNLGKNKTTKPYLPFRIIFIEECENRIEARKLEKHYKSGVGKEKLKVIRDQSKSCL